MKQTILTAGQDGLALSEYLSSLDVRRVFLVCGRSGLWFESLLRRLGMEVVRFSDFKPNPTFQSAEQGAGAFRASGCRFIAAVGGGSAMDVAKCVRLWQPEPERIPLLAVPTTAGTGSEATRFAVIYRDGQKQSVHHELCLPTAVLFDPGALSTLPAYHRKASMLDALCHAIESCWSVNSTDASMEYAGRAIRAILEHMPAYLNNTPDGNAGMLQAAYTAGQAINLTQTTAGHAMCYQLTSRYGAAHGHAAALCVAALWPYMLAHPDACIDPRGPVQLQEAYRQLAQNLGCRTPEQAAEWFRQLLADLDMRAPAADEADLPALAASVNAERLKNHPVRLTPEVIGELYRQILAFK